MFLHMNCFQMSNQAVSMADVGAANLNKRTNKSSTKFYLNWKWQKKTLCTSKHKNYENEYYST